MGVSHKFDIYDQERDICTTCIWKIRENGLMEMRLGKEEYPPSIV